MKTKLFTIAIALSSVVAMAQKKEIKNAEKAIEDGNYAEAKALLNSVESMIAGEKEKVQADFYYVKGIALVGNNNKNNQEIIAGAEALNKAAALGHDEAQNKIDDLVIDVYNSAVQNSKAKRFKEASDELYISYQLDKKDTLKLFLAAGTALNAKEYDKSLEYYQELNRLGYDGRKLVYTAVNKTTQEVESFATANQRDVYIRVGSHSNPSVEREESKRPEIVKNIAIIYFQKGDNDKAFDAIQQARKQNPKDIGLMLAEAEIYSRANDLEKYNSILQEIIKLEPNNADLYYNLGISTSKSGDNEAAAKFYKKAIEINPEHTDAYINLASIVLAKEKPIIEEMNNLGMSAADNKRYEALQNERKEIYRSSLEYLEAAKKRSKEGTDSYKGVVQTLYQIYSFLGEEEKAKALKN
ncbi:lipopolysaccharide assembly protein LapB [Mesonia sp. K7]|uniref:tetratricopeptide repeat protein n=1 Tax=Mesonia sp. K7 TaxID=2218606 RepID=UPI000DA9C215|nr:tetratricopeptide repeat protein [Mesonia sp. K7]PZD79258.1 hypothetical protein DNG35_01885 [Mesonia sp. K7]